MTFFVRRPENNTQGDVIGLKFQEVELSKPDKCVDRTQFEIVEGPLFVPLFEVDSLWNFWQKNPFQKEFATISDIYYVQSSNQAI